MSPLKIIFSVFALTMILSCSKDNGNETTLTDENGNPVTVDVSANRKSVGDSSNDLLSDTTFKAISFEIFYVEGLKPNDGAIENFEAFLNDRLNKPNGVQIQLKSIVSPQQAVYSITDIRNLEDEIRTLYNQEGEIGVFGLYIDGEYAENTENGSVLGVAYRNTSFVIFEETIKSFSGRPLGPSTTTLESVVLNHEFGHLLGLVNAGSTMQNPHQDIQNGRHCTDENCLMYWTAETGEGLLNALSGGSVPALDADCLADLKANGGR
jgi:hypothetical protein